MSTKEITSNTRQNICDETILSKLLYHGQLTEPDFLAQLFDLKHMPSRVYRYKNAYDEIYQQTVNFEDKSNNWIYGDSRINLLYCEDELFLKFLTRTIHPIVRSNQEEINRLLEIYNRHLNADGFEIVLNDTIAGKPVFSWRKTHIKEFNYAENQAKIRKYLNTDYVKNKLDIMKDALEKEETDLAIGTAKELLETMCKSILKQKNIPVDKNWELTRIMKETANSIDLLPKKVDDATKAESSIKQMLGGISSIVQGITELRNSYGTGHGKDADFKGLENPYARLIVGVVSEIAIFYLAINGETAELIDE